MELAEKLNSAGLDFAIFDGEMLPWSLKAEKLIADTFLGPGECAMACREYTHGLDSKEYKNAQLFVKL